ncbi:hypothetical protein PENTCL1PPCAC_14915, partial [Pristionchus entomophagus]
MPDSDLASDQFEYSPGEPRPPPPIAKYDVPPGIEDEYAVLRKTPDIVETEFVREEVVDENLIQEEDKVEQSVSIEITSDDFSEDLMPSPSGRDRRCCATALEAVTKNHVGCLSGMASEGGAERSGTLEIERRLLASDLNGETALHLAVREGDEEMAKLLLSLAPSLRERQSLSGETAVLLAAALGRQKMLSELLSSEDAMRTAVLTDINGTSALMAAVVRGDNEMANYLLKKFGRTLLLLPNRSHMLPVHVAAAQGNLDFLKAAVKVESNVVHCRDEFGCTPAFYTAQGGCLTTLRYLVEKAKASLYAANNKGMSLLHVSCIAGHYNIVRYLLAKMGTSAVTAVTKDYANAVHCAAFTGRAHILAMLLGCFAKRKRKDVLAVRDSRGNTPLHLAAIGNYVDTALFLVEAGAEPALLNLQHQTAREVALIRGHGSLAGVLAGAKAGKSKKRRSLAIPTPLPALMIGPQSRSMHDLSNGNGPVVLVRPMPHPSDLYGHLAKDTVRVVEVPSPNHHFVPDRRASPYFYSPMRVQIAGQPRAPSSMDSYAQTSPLPTRLLMMKSSPRSPNALSSGYSSAGESHEPKPELTKRHLDYVDSASSDEEGSRRDGTVQTDVDELRENIKHIDDVTWMSEGLNAVDALDRVLKEFPSLTAADLEPSTQLTLLDELKNKFKSLKRRRVEAPDAPDAPDPPTQASLVKAPPPIMKISPP